MELYRSIDVLATAWSLSGLSLFYKKLEAQFVDWASSKTYCAETGAG